MKEFFFDTANSDYIIDFWEKTKNKIDKNLVLGITTNPNAFHKIGKPNLDEWFDATKKLCNIISDIRRDDKGVVYIQCPNSIMSPAEVIEYAKIVSQLSDGKTKIGLKIPPFFDVLNISEQLNEYVDVNVTGISDCCTALKCLSYPVKFVSVIPGRMEEVGINAKEQIEYINQSNNSVSRIITGSMRTIEQVIWTFQYKTVPTIGERVLSKFFDNEILDSILNIDYNISVQSNKQFSPIINNANLTLSLEFFKQMDDLGLKAYNDYKMK